MRYLITGGLGFLGSNLSSEVLSRGEELYVFDNLFRNGSELNLRWLKNKGTFKFYRSDIRNYNDVEIVIKDIKPDVIFHLAGQVAMTTSIQNPRLDFEINALGTSNLLDAVRKYSDESIILYSSTNKVYGDLENFTYLEEEKRYRCKEYPNGFDESTPLDFHSPYGCSKGAADQYLLDYYRIFNIRTVVFRHSSMYGVNQFPTYDQGWVGWFCQKALEFKNNKYLESITISGNGKQVRDLVYVDDLVRLYFNSASEIEKIKGNAFNIGGGIKNSLSILELFDYLEKKYALNIKYRQIEKRISDQRVFVANTNKIYELINWKPQITYQTGIEKFIQWNCNGSA
jgi:CDP-paratose 2-epimerase